MRFRLRTYSFAKPLLIVLLGTFLLQHGSLGAAPEPQQGEPVQFLFIHHSCGGQLLAEPGSEELLGPAPGSRCIYASHPNGGGLRTALESAGFAVNEASYGSIVGEDTDIRHWLDKFSGGMNRILATRNQDALLPGGERNRIVAFKSCFPNNAFVAEGSGPGDPRGTELTVANAKAAYTALLPLFRSHPDVLFVAFTAPPVAEPKPVGWKAKLKRMFQGAPRHGELAVAFNEWLAGADGAADGWLSSYELDNVAVFDYFGILSRTDESGWSAYPTQQGRDSHPSSEGNSKAAAEFVPFVEDAYRNMQNNEH